MVGEYLKPSGCYLHPNSQAAPPLRQGKHGDYNVLVIDRLGTDLERLFKMCNHHFSLKTVLMLADQLVRILIDG
jgi:hypothetical protein